MPWASYPLLRHDQTPPQTEWVNTNTGDFRHFPGAGPRGEFPHDRKHGPDQQVVAFGSFYAELARALEQDAVDVGFSACKKPVTQRRAAALAIRVRRRAIAASWSAWLSSGVATMA